MHDEIKIGKFDLLATYSYAKALLNSLAEFRDAPGHATLVRA